MHSIDVQTMKAINKPGLSTACLLLVVALLAPQRSLQAAKETFERTKPHVNICTTGKIDENMMFFADIKASLPTGKATGALGFIIVEDGYVLSYEAVAAVANGGRPLLIIAEDVEGEALALLVQPNGQGPDHLSWQIIDPGDQTCPAPTSFSLPGEIVSEPGVVLPEANGPGRPGLAKFPAQEVRPLGLSDVLEFQAQVELGPHPKGFGFVEMCNAEEEFFRRWDVLLAMQRSRGLIGIVLAIPGELLGPDTIVFATVQETAVVGCDIWILTGNGVVGLSSSCHLRFDARGTILLADPPLRR